MKREIIEYDRHCCGCCPGHDRFPNGTYKNRRSKKQRAKDKKREHKVARGFVKRNVAKEAQNYYT
ncbi:hypothetical protein PBI_SCTP2_387 [Salicola phage SCTP-2]|nr:hypothetical protein PBI_SCTP2_387 [Salicola phage SCTP-2]